MLKPEITPKSTLLTVDCPHCWATNYAHEWVPYPDLNEMRDAIAQNRFNCMECGKHIDRPVVTEQKRVYAGRYSAPGYLDATDWEYDTNVRRLERGLRKMYGD